ncbi:MAG TPA: dihydroorotase [Acidiferrobacteraceae bacterium]|nr:dihydroorotase [Acidiferrobacteraceae bacterium]
MYSLLIRNALIAQPDGNTIVGDVACEHGRIGRIDPQIDALAEETLDAQGRLLLPGVIDPQVHFREPGNEHKEDLGSGSRAAVAGGVTSFLEMPNTAPATIDQTALDDKLSRAAQKSVANYGFFIGATPDNVDALNSVSPVCGIKIFMGSSTGSLLVNRRGDLERIFANGDRLIAVHAEDEARINARLKRFAGRTDTAVHSEIRDNQCAVLATELALELSIQHQRRLHILHLSTHEEVDILRRNKPEWVSAETIPNHLFLNVADYERLGSLVQMNPPIRQAQDNSALWQGLRDGVIDFIATDHAPHTLEEKQRPYPKSPSGMPGVQTSLPLILTRYAAGDCNLAEVLRWMSAGPAQAYGLIGKGQISEDWDADLTLVDMDTVRPVKNEEMFSKAGWSPYVGRGLTGWPVYTVVGGHIAFEKDSIRDGIRGQALRYSPTGDIQPR